MDSAMARPMPRLEPVITATLSWRSNGVGIVSPLLNESATAGVDDLAGHIARARPTEEAHHGRDVLGRAAPARQGVVDRMVLRLDKALFAHRGHEARGDAVDRHVVFR